MIKNDIENLQSKILTYSAIQRPGLSIENESLDSELWEESFINSLGKNFFLMLLFVAFNVGVNTFSEIGNIGKLTPSFLLIGTIILTGLATTYANTLSKFPDITKAVDALNLNAKQRQYYNNLESKLEEIISFQGTHVICLDENDITIFEDEKSTHNLEDQFREIPHKMLQALQLLQEKYFNSVKKELKIIKKAEITSCPSHDKLVILTDLDLRKTTSKQTIIRFYQVGWVKRLQHTFATAPITKGIPTLTKALLSFVRWNFTMGIPSLVILLTGVHALSKIENVSHLSSRLIRLLLLVTNLMISAVKTHINYDLKQKRTDREFRKLIESTWHLQPMNLSIKSILMTTIAFLLCSFSMFPNVVTTSFFYSAEGPLTFAKECGAITGFDFSFSEFMITIITWAAVVTSLPTAFATSMLPFYRKLNGHKTKNNEKAEEAMQDYPKTAMAFKAAIWIDSLVFGGNARFNAIKSMQILGDKYSVVDSFLSQHCLIKEAIAGTVGLGVSILAIYWCYYTGMEKFKDNMELVEEIKSRSGNLFSFFSKNTQNTSDLETPLLDQELRDIGFGGSDFRDISSQKKCTAHRESFNPSNTLAFTQ